MATARHLDLDALLSEERSVILSGRELIVPDMPLETTLRLAKMKQELKDAEGGEQLEAVIEVVSELLAGANPDLTQEWLVKNLTMRQTLALVEFIVAAEGELGEGEAANTIQQQQKG